MVSFLNFLVVFISVILSISVFPHFSAFLLTPIFPLFVIVALGYYRKGFEPFILAAIAGILMDLFTSYPFGAFLVFFLLVIAFLRNFFQEGMRTISFWYYFGFTLGFSLLAQLAEVIFHISNKGLISLNYLWYLAGFVAVTSVFSMLFYLFMTWYFEKTEKLENYLKRR